MGNENQNEGSRQERAEKPQEKKAAGERPAGQLGAAQPRPAERAQPAEIARRGAFLPGVFGRALATSPFGLMRRMVEDMDRMLEEFGFGRGETLWAPQVDVFEREGELVVRADLPGMNEKDIRIEVQGDILVLAGDRKYEHEKQEGGVWRSERSYGVFRRAIPLPEGTDPNNITATFDNGVLEVCVKLPPQERQSKRIEVKSGSGAQPQKGAAGERGKAPVH